MSRNPEFQQYNLDEKDFENFLPPAPTEEEIEKASKQFEKLLNIPRTQWQKEQTNEFIDSLTNFPILFNIYPKECEEILKDGVRKELHNINPFDLPSWDSTFYSLLNSNEEFSYLLLYTQSETINFGDEMEEILNQKAKEIFRNAKNTPIPEILEALYSLKINFNFNLDVKKELEDIIRQLIEQNDFSTIQELIYTYNLYLDENFGKNEKFNYNAVLQERLVLAEQCIQLEKNITQYKNEQDIEASFPETPALKKLKEVFHTYAEQEAETAKMKLRVFEILGLPPEASPEMVGSQFFFKRTKTEPLGKVKLTVQEAYFIISFSEKEDYKKLLPGREESGGLYHRAFKLSLGENFSFPALFISRDEGMYYYQNIVDHERQHFINNLADLKKLEDEYGINKWGVQKHGLQKVLKQREKIIRRSSQNFNEEQKNKSLRGLKDEWLAYLRDGSNPKEISQILCEDPLYSHWYNFPDEDKEKMKKLIQEIADTIHSTKIFPKISREMFVYTLIDVPLSAWPKFIVKLARYLKKPQNETSPQWKEKQKKQVQVIKQSKEKEKRSFLEEEFEEGRFGKNNKNWEK